MVAPSRGQHEFEFGKVSMLGRLQSIESSTKHCSQHRRTMLQFPVSNQHSTTTSSNVAPDDRRHADARCVSANNNNTWFYIVFFKMPKVTLHCGALFSHSYSVVESYCCSRSCPGGGPTEARLPNCAIILRPPPYARLSAGPLWSPIPVLTRPYLMGSGIPQNNMFTEEIAVD